MKAEIITIGDEILIGQIVDTNSAWMARQLNLAGVEIFRITSVHDRKEDILYALEKARQEVSLVLMTGGLGPTKDDITKKTLCEYFNTRLILHQPTLDKITERFNRLGIPVNRLNRDQALVPASCEVIFNRKGTAPGMWFEKSGTVFVSMPGVPFEMEAMMTEEILPRLISSGKTIHIMHKTVLTQGVAESVLAEKLEKWETSLPEEVKVAYLPNPLGVKLRLSLYGDNSAENKSKLEDALHYLLPLINDCVYGFDDETLPQVIGSLLTTRNRTVSVAESCTGGNISHLITLTPGSSHWFTGSITAYSNSVKTEILGVLPETLEKYGAVSSQTVSEMAAGIRKLFRTDYAVATSGIAGPEGGSEEKPVGTVWIAVAGPLKFFCEKYVFGHDRERIILRSSQTALQLLRKMIIEDYTG